MSITSASGGARSARSIRSAPVATALASKPSARRLRTSTPRNEESSSTIRSFGPTSIQVSRTESRPRTTVQETVTNFRHPGRHVLPAPKRNRGTRRRRARRGCARPRGLWVVEEVLLLQLLEQLLRRRALRRSKIGRDRRHPGQPGLPRLPELEGRLFD